MKVLLFGGSFNPVHVGHLVMAQEVRAQFGYDMVLFVPSFSPPHKKLEHDAGPAHRLAMLRLAIEGDPTLDVDDCEIRRGGISYTIDTIREVRERYPLEGKPGLILGDDLVPGFSSWRDPDGVAGEADIICARRDSSGRLEMTYPHRYADNPIIAVSSSLIRQRIASGKPFRHFLSRPVFDYILRESLYGER